jgi:cell division control protein 6
MREECKELIKEMLQFEISGVPNHQAVIGSRGSGKTLMLKYLQRIIPQQTSLEMLYVNCRHQNTSFRIFSSLLAEPTAGASLAELYERFLAKYPKKTVVVLDEVDLMTPKDKHREILYMLSRSEQPYMIVMLSNSPHVLKQLDAATRSSLQPAPLHFRNYDAEQIQQILQDRAERGLHAWDQGSLAQIAALTTRLTNSDARVAIKTLKYAATKPGEDLQEAFEQARRDIVVDMVNDLSDANLMILWAAASTNSDLAKDIYQRYCRFSQDHQEKPISYVYFYGNLSYLQSMGLVALVSTKVDRAYTNRVLLTFDTAIADSLSRLRFG